MGLNPTSIIQTQPSKQMLDQAKSVHIKHLQVAIKK